MAPIHSNTWVAPFLCGIGDLRSIELPTHERQRRIAAMDPRRHTRPRLILGLLGGIVTLLGS